MLGVFAAFARVDGDLVYRAVHEAGVGSVDVLVDVRRQFAVCFLVIGLLRRLLGLLLVLLLIGDLHQTRKNDLVESAE